MSYTNMSHIRKPVSTVAPRKYTSTCTDYVPQHPMAAFHQAPPPVERPFQHAEWSLKGFTDGAKKAASSVGKFVADKRYKYAVNKVSNLVDSIESETRHMPNKVSAYKKKLDSDIKAQADKLKKQRQDEPAKIAAYRGKLAAAVDAKEAKIKKIRQSQKDKDAFDDAVEDKLDEQEEKIYADATR